MVGCLDLKAAVRRGGINSSWGAAGECCSLLSKCGSAGPGHPTAPHFWAQPHLPAQALPQPLCVFPSQVWLASLGSAQEINMRYVCMSLLFIKEKKNQEEGIPLLLFTS